MRRFINALIIIMVVIMLGEAAINLASKFITEIQPIQILPDDLAYVKEIAIIIVCLKVAIQIIK